MKHTYYYSTEAVVRRCSVKKGVPRNSAKCTRKHTWWSLFNKVAGSLQLYSKQDSGRGVFL